MAQTIASSFRQTFKLTSREVLQWFPGHMEKGIKQMQHKLFNVDCIIEVHDSRIPISGRNPNFKSMLYAIRPHILVMNKKDLTDSSQNVKVTKYLKDQGYPNVIYTNCKNDKCTGVKSIIPMMEELIGRSERYHRAGEYSYQVMVIGVPNVGKSSLINTFRNRNLRKQNAAPVGAVAGITRSVQNRIKISENPEIYMLDTPGILTPSVQDDEAGLKLALCAALPDHLVGEDIIADYLLYWLNKHSKFKYVELLGLDEPCDNIAEVLTKGAVHLKKYIKKRSYDGRLKLYPDHILAARHMIAAFRTGSLGKILLDRITTDENNKIILE